MLSAAPGGGGKDLSTSEYVCDVIGCRRWVLHEGA